MDEDPSAKRSNILLTNAARSAGLFVTYVSRESTSLLVRIGFGRSCNALATDGPLPAIFSSDIPDMRISSFDSTLVIRLNIFHWKAARVFRTKVVMKCIMGIARLKVV